MGFVSNSEVLFKARSTNELGRVITLNLEELNKKIKRADEMKSKLDALIAEESGESDDSFFDEETEGGKHLSAEVTDPSKLIDLELINLLKYCRQLES